MNSASTQDVEKLDDENYDVWKLQMRSVLVCNDLWGYVNGTNEAPEDGDDLLAWKTKDEKALALIVLAVTTSELRHIKQAETSKSAWDQLEKYHKLNRPVKKAVLCRQFLQMRKSPQQTVSQYVNEFIKRSNLLEKSGIKIPGDMLSIVLLNSLPQSYENFRNAIESGDDIPSLEILKVKLCEEEERLNGTQSPMELSSVSSQSSLSLTETPRREYTRQENPEVKFQGKCYTCQQFGHKAADCTEDGDSEMGSDNGTTDEPLLGPRFPGKCFVCEKYGHRAVDCKDIWESERERNLAIELAAIQPEVVWVLKVFGEDEWRLDVGVTSHVCNDRKKFADINEEGDNNTSEDGARKRDVNHNVRGTVLMNFDVNGDQIIVNAGNTKYEPNSKNNLYSVPRLTNLGCTIKFYANHALLIDPNGVTTAIAEKKILALDC